MARDAGDSQKAGERVSREAGGPGDTFHHQFLKFSRGQAASEPL